MDVIAEIIVRLIESLMGAGRPPMSAARRPTTAAAPPRRPPPPMPPTGRQRRRPALSARVAVAEPILTLTMDDLVAAGPAVAAPATARQKTDTPARRTAAADLRQRLTPASLRQQVLLSEILRPPLALRDEHG